MCADRVSAQPNPAAEALKKDPLNNRLQVIRLRLSWQGPLVWVAHLDRMRALERALLRARLPLAYSQGYNPRPQIVFGLPSGAGIASEAEYIDVSLEAPLALDDAAEAIARELPPGITLAAIGEVPIDRAKKLMASIRAADYLYRRSGIAAKMRLMLAHDELTVMKFSKKKERPLEIKELILRSEELSPDLVRLRVRAGSRANLRPDLVLDALQQYAGDEDSLSTEICKEEMWILPEKKADYLQRPLPREGEMNTLPWQDS